MTLPYWLHAVAEDTECGRCTADIDQGVPAAWLPSTEPDGDGSLICFDCAVLVEDEAVQRGAEAAR